MVNAGTQFQQQVHICDSAAGFGQPALGSMDSDPPAMGVWSNYPAGGMIALVSVSSSSANSELKEDLPSHFCERKWIGPPPNTLSKKIGHYLITDKKNMLQF